MVRWIMLTLFSLVILIIIYFANQTQRPEIFKIVYLIPHGDKVGHFVLIGLLAFFVNLAVGSRMCRLGRWQVLRGSVVLSILVILEELSQIWIPARTFSLVDMAFDFMGIAFFGQLARKINQRTLPPEPHPL